MVALKQKQIEKYESTPVVFIPYEEFEGEKTNRTAQKNAFLNNEEYSPDYDYPRLDNLRFNDKVTKEKTAVYQAMLELEAAKLQPGANLAELNLYVDFYTRRLQMIMLAEAARDLKDAGTSSEWEVAEDTFMTLNVELYGEFDVPKYQGMMSTEYKKATEFEPTSERAQKIKDQLLGYLEGAKSDQEVEKPLMDQESLQKLHDVIVERFKDTLSAVPDTDDSVYYDAKQIVDILNDTFKANGLAKRGWKAKVDPYKTVPATDPDEKVKTIAIPSDTRRNAREIRRLAVHEEEDHARMAQNGLDTGLLLLAKGTANNPDVEEGLGVLFECALEGNWDNASFKRARDRYITAGLALGSETQAPRDARQVHDVLWRILAIRNSTDGDITPEGIKKARLEAYTHVENAFRGTEFWMRGMIYMKLKLYYEGLEKNAKFFLDNLDDLNSAIDVALSGKSDHTNEAERNTVNDMIKHKRRRVSYRVKRTLSNIVNKRN